MSAEEPKLKRDYLDVTGGWLHGLREWIDARFPMSSFWKKHVSEYYAPKNFNFWYFFGSIALLILVNQILTGIFLAMNYQPSATGAFASVEYIMRDVDWGWLLRYMHSVGASMFFVVVYLHMFRGVMYGSFKKPRELLWIFGVLIYVALMAEAFMGYLLPWGQMSYWGANVIISLFGAIPGIGNTIETWIKGDFGVSGITLNRFFALHVAAVPLVLLGLVLFHLIALHEVGSNNPDGVEIKKHKDPATGIPLDGIPFHPYYTIKDITGVIVFIAIFSAIIFFAPGMHGLFLEPANFEPANPLKTPSDIHPLWYFGPYYAILRSIPNKELGALALLVAVVILFFLPWIDRNPVKSIRYRGPLYRWVLVLFAVTFIVLGYIGMQLATLFWAEIGQRLSELYFLFFVTAWVYSKPRSRAFLVGTFVVVMIIISLLDWISWAPSIAHLKLWSWLIPFGYCLIFLLWPAAMPRLMQPKPVPERVRTKARHGTHAGVRAE
ncbi:MAG: cytochrome b N-terminal domain-containing protein [Gammaproteobacteria bacterium]|nr:cytochrome b N-terminal domain-containing protein [Gammaproteobacteria bacterium]MDE2023948.1 cytochrome b N-terminal domain-containing protein [Gammaproteobacteria bacterium]